MAQAFVTGLGRVLRFPSLVVWLYLASLAAALPLAVVMRATLAQSIGASTVEEKLREGFDLGWHGEFEYARPSGLASTFGPDVAGALPLLDNLERLLDGELLRAERTVLGAGLLFLLLWAFFAGGVLDRYAFPDAEHSRARLFAKGGEYFFRFLRLLVISVLFYLLIAWMGGWLHARVEDWTRDVTVERTVILLTALVYAAVGLLLVLAGMALDYAKIAMVAEQRSSAVLAFFRGLGFVLAHPLQTFGLYLLLVLVGAAVMALYGLFAPGVGQSTWTTVLVAFLIGQAYLLARLILKLWFLSSQTLLFQSANTAFAEPEPPPSTPAV